MSSLRVSTTIRKFVVIMIIGIGVLTPLIPSVLAEDDPSLLNGPTVIDLPETAILPKPETARRELLQGERVGADCRFSVSFQSEKQDITPQMVRMIAIDPTTCTAEVERGEPITLPALPGDERKARKPAVLRADVGGEGQNKDRQATHWTIWEDPAYVAVAVVRNSVKSKVKSKKMQRANCTVEFDPLSQTGWQIEAASRNFDCNWSDKKASSVASAHFFNDDFLGIVCSGRDRTHVYIQQNFARVTLKREEGDVQYSYSSGGCSTLLGWGTYREPGVYYN